MKEAIKYGLYLAIVFIIHSIVFFFFNQPLLYEYFSYLTLWYIFLYICFMFLALFKNRTKSADSGTYFKIALLTFFIAHVVSHGFDYILANAYADELNPIYLEEQKNGKRKMDAFIGEDPLVSLEEVELLDDTIEKERDIGSFFMNCLTFFLLIGIPLSFFVTFIGQHLLKNDRLSFLNN